MLVTAPTGAHPRLRAETLARLKKAGYTLERHLEQATWDELFEEALTPSLFSSRQIIEVDDGSSLGPLPERYARHVESGAADSVFLIFSDKTMQKDLGAAYRLAEIVPYEAAPRWPNQRVTWLQKLARAKGWTIDSSAASLLVEWVDDEEELRGELDKLGAAAIKGRITAVLVRELSIDESGKAMLKLLDALAKGDVSAAVAAFSALREGGALIPVLAGAHKRVRAACLFAALGEEAIGLLRLSPYQSNIAKAMARLYGPRLLPLMLGELIRLSWVERKGDSEGWEGLERLLLVSMSFAKNQRARA